jgi:NADPH2:quinone reductase
VAIRLRVANDLKRPEDLNVVDLPAPNPKPDEYLIAIHASATNFFDLLQIRGKYQHQPAFPWVAGSEFSGVVLKAPTTLPNGRTPKYKEGDKVFGASQGGYATHIVSTEEKMRPMPDGWSFMDAAGLFVTGPTSYAGLVIRAGIKKGTFLFHMAV